MTDTRRVARMQALELFGEVALERAHRDDDLRPLAVLAEAWRLNGFPDYRTLVDCLPYQPLRTDERAELVERALRGRPRRLLRADARGVLLAIDYALETGLFTGPLTSEALRLRWLARGGHDAR